MRLALLERGKVCAVFLITGDDMVIGRDPEADLVLSDPRASKRHARITCTGGEICVEDAGSRNGTRVNEHRIKAQVLNPGDLLRMGQSVLLCLTPGMPLEREGRRAVGWVVGDVPGTGRAGVPVTEVPLLVGRADEANIGVTDEGLAPFHAQIVSVPGGAQFTDLTGGALRCAMLSDGQELKLGPLALAYRLSPDAAGASAAADVAAPSSVRSGAGAPVQPKTALPDLSPDLDADGSLSDTLMDEADHAETAAATSENAVNVPLSHRAGACTLTATSGPCRGKAFPVTQKAFIIGRGPKCTVSLDDERVSRRHARIERVEGDVVIEDLGSANGVFVNAKRIRRHPLRPGDTIRIGASEFLVHL